MEKRILNITESISYVLSLEKAYNISGMCLKYNIGDGSIYSSPSSKERFIWNLLIKKDEKFILSLAKRVVDDYKSDQIGLALNQYYDGKFFKLSVVTRKDLLAELYDIGCMQGCMTTEDS